jgi:hypothetical protein
LSLAPLTATIPTIIVPALIPAIADKLAPEPSGTFAFGEIAVRIAEEESGQNPVLVPATRSLNLAIPSLAREIIGK